MMTWPAHYPNQCPPSSASSTAGVVYRFINGRNPAAKDFLSYYHLKPEHDWGTQECNARGLSVYADLSACYELAEAVPAMKKKKIAVAKFSAPLGVWASTPSSNCQGHKTWWLPENIQNIVDVFTVIARESSNA
ncbi:hypothetical protein [Pseudomonas petroselini]